jgi:hypothetical protein
MLALAYAGLRREELCLLATGAVDPAPPDDPRQSGDDQDAHLACGPLLRVDRAAA